MESDRDATTFDKVFKTKNFVRFRSEMPITFASKFNITCIVSIWKISIFSIYLINTKL